MEQHIGKEIMEDCIFDIDWNSLGKLWHLEDGYILQSCRYAQALFQVEAGQEVCCKCKMLS